jgi:hypothetical protein
LKIDIGDEQNFRVTVTAEPPTIIRKSSRLNAQMGMAALNDMLFEESEFTVVLIDVVFFDVLR